MDILALVIVVVAAFLTALLSSVAGFGGSRLPLPVFVAVFGIRDAVPILDDRAVSQQWEPCLVQSR